MKKSNVDILQGPITRGLLAMAFPIIVMNVMQTLFNVIDMTVLKMYSTDTAVGAVGASGTLITLCTSLFVGLSAGANVAVAKRIGSGDREKVRKAATSALLAAVVGGIVLMIVGVSCAEIFLKLTNCPLEILPDAVLYFRIYFIGAPLLLIANFCSAMLRAAGDTKKQMRISVTGGIMKVITTLLFVAVFKMEIVGVGIANIMCWVVMSVWGLVCVIRHKDIPVDFKKIRFYKQELKDILFIGIPSGLQTAMYSFANVIIMTTVNDFGPNATTGVSIANQFDGIMYQLIYAPSLAATPYIAQNIGAGNIDRVKKAIVRAVLITTTIGLTFGLLSAIFSKQLSSIMSSSPKIIEFSQQKMILISSTYFICGINEIMGGVLKGMGKPIVPTVATMLYMCGIRFVWVYMVFPHCPQNLTYLYLIWPIGWILSIATLLAFYFPAIKKLNIEAMNHKNAPAN